MTAEKKAAPPRLALWLMERVVWNDDYEYASGDFSEMYERHSKERGTLRAGFWCWLEIARYQQLTLLGQCYAQELFEGGLA
jgi:hypothetical protein